MNDDQGGTEGLAEVTAASSPPDEHATGPRHAHGIGPGTVAGATAEQPAADEGTEKAGPEKSPGRRGSAWRELPILIVVALAIALVIKSFVVQPFFIPSSSMENTLLIGDKVLVNKLVYDFRG